MGVTRSRMGVASRRRTVAKSTVKEKFAKKSIAKNIIIQKEIIKGPIKSLSDDDGLELRKRMDILFTQKFISIGFMLKKVEEKTIMV